MHDAGTPKRKRRFSSIDHPNPEAVAAFVDDELSSTAKHRVHIHLVHCEECRDEVNRQRLASARLRACEDVSAPEPLLHRLQSIAKSCPDGPGVEDTVMERFSLRSSIEQASRRFRHLREEG
ncbi:anti-sigma factor family protein [Corynebacterium gerontici]|uniref:Anti-sigma-E factor RseA n=1 Tax=Corynebacterium gerontici TaxID=2079234 RepID=A0A3G6IZF3_9CORY|nr:zf-HC2 domain-containing protein [Corynebacterium gerontici]AZA11171.1 Anti-sigma-E factor RseA [Corynebacterium gerontici]